MIGGQNQPLPKPCRTPGRIRFDLFKGICYLNMYLDLKFQVNQSINKDFTTRGGNQPLPKPCLTPGRNRVNLYQSIRYQKICLDFKFQVNPTTNKDFRAQLQVTLSLDDPNTHTNKQTNKQTHTHTHTHTNIFENAKKVIY